MFDSFLNRLSYFTAKKGIKFFGPASGASIEAAERKLGVLFTNEMKNFWLKFNGCSLVEISIVGIPQLDYRRIPKSHDIVEINLNKRSFGFWPENCLVQDFINSIRVSVPIFRPCRTIGSVWLKDYRTLQTP